MLAPDSLNIDVEDRVVKAKKIAVELHIDNHLRMGVFTVPPPPMGVQYNINGTEVVFKHVERDIINALLDKYRALGWTKTGNGPWMFIK